MLARAGAGEEHKQATRVPGSAKSHPGRAAVQLAMHSDSSDDECKEQPKERREEKSAARHTEVVSSDSDHDSTAARPPARSAVAATSTGSAAAAASIAASAAPAPSASSALDELDPALRSFAQLLLTPLPASNGDRAVATSSSSLRKRPRDGATPLQRELDRIGSTNAATAAAAAPATAFVAIAAATRISAPSPLLQSSSPSPGKPVRRGRPPKRWNYDSSFDEGVAAQFVSPQCAFPSPGALAHGTSPFLWENSVDLTTPLNFLYITSNDLHPSTCHAANVGADGDGFMLPCSCPGGRCRPSTCGCAQSVENQYTTSGQISGRQSDFQRYCECSDLCPCAKNEHRTTSSSSSSAAAAAAAAAPPSPIVLDEGAGADKRRKRSARQQSLPPSSAASVFGSVPPCFNRVVQRRPISDRVVLAVFRTPGGERGWGLKTLMSIPKHTFVAEYLGERIHEYVTEARGKLFENRKEMTYVMTPHLREQVQSDYKADATAATNSASGAARSKSSSSGNGGRKNARGRKPKRIGGTFSSSDEEEEDADRSSGDDSNLDWQHSNEPYSIDASAMGGVARFCNHSHKPNLVAVEVLIEHRDPRLPRFALFARENIQPGTELTFNYGIRHTSKQEFVCTCISCKEVDKKQEAITRREAAADARAAAAAAAARSKGASSPASVGAVTAKSKGKMPITPTAPAPASAAAVKKFPRMRHTVGSGAASRNRLSASPPAPTAAPALAPAATLHPGGSWGMPMMMWLPPPPDFLASFAAVVAIAAALDAAAAQPMDIDAHASAVAPATPATTSRHVILELSDSSNNEHQDLSESPPAAANVANEVSSDDEEGDDMPPLIHLHSTEQESTALATPADRPTSSTPAGVPASAPREQSAPSATAAASTTAAVATSAAAAAAAAAPFFAADDVAASPRLFTPSEFVHLLWQSALAHFDQTSAQLWNAATRS